MDEVTIGLGVAGSVTLGVLISNMTDVLHDYFPNLSGRWAIGAVDMIALIGTLILLIATDTDWGNPLTYGIIPGVWLGLRIIARGYYSHKKEQRGG